MSECPHCRAVPPAAHRHECSVARKQGLERLPRPVPPLYLGAVVVVDRRAAIIVSLDPVIARVLVPHDVDYEEEAPDWKWPAGRV